MSDLETRIAEGLAGTAGRAPRPTDLAGGARARLRRRRRTTATVVAAALAVVAIPVAVAVLSGGGPGGGRPDRDPTTVAEQPPGWRTETWHDLSVRVPPAWGFGGGTDWCTSGRDVTDTPPQVSRPAGVIPMIACKPSYGYGVHFSQPSSGELPPGTEGVVQQYRGSRYPDGSWIGYASTDGAAVWVVTDDRTSTRQVLDSATPVGVVDANGCPPRQHQEVPVRDQVVVCRYEETQLVQSEVLSAEDSRSAVAALRSAPIVRRLGDLCGDTPVMSIRMVGAGIEGGVVPQCRTAYAAGENRRLTSDVLYWALSPGWSGALPRGAPLPERLRSR